MFQVGLLLMGPDIDVAIHGYLQAVLLEKA